MIGFLSELGLNEVRIFLVSYTLSSNKSLEKFHFSIEIADSSLPINLSIFNSPYRNNFPNKGNYDSDIVKFFIDKSYKNLTHKELKSSIRELLNIIFKNNYLSEGLFHTSRGIVFKPMDGKLELL